MSRKNPPPPTKRTPAAWGRRRLSPVLAAVASLLLAGAVHAQQSAGAITGQGSQGDVISIENKSINITRQIRVDASGTWQASQLPPGIYTVTVTRASGAKETIQVQVTGGQGALAAFSGVQSVTVTGSALRTIDLSTVTSSYTLSKAEIERIPVPANVTAVTLLSPGAVAGDGAFGNLASLGGASVAENAYYINGFNVTNILKGLAFNEVPFEAIGEVQVKNGGYSVEYGRSLGGVVAVNTKRGSNSWKSGAKLSVAPAGLRASSVYAEKNASGTYDLIERPGSSDSTILSAYAGGPIIRDKLFVFGLVQGENSNSSVYGQDNQTRAKVDTPKYLLKVDWNLNDNNLIELTAFNDKSTQKVDNFTAPSPYSGVRGTFLSTDRYTTGGENLIGKWTINLSSNLNISALAGQGKYARSNAIYGASCPAVYDGRPPRTTLQYLGCWSESAGLAVDDPNANDKRTAYRIDLEWTLGKHTIRAGLDNEVYDTVDGSQYSGGHYYRLFTLPAGRSIAGTGYTNTTGASIDYVRDRVFQNGGTFQTKNAAFYIEDNFQVTKNLLLNLGVRSESFNNLNDKGETFIKVDNTIAPRGGVSWDVNGNGQTRVYSNLGRYYIPVYANTNVRLSGTETFYTDFFRFNGTFSTDGKSVPSLGSQLGARVVTSNGVTPDPRTVVDPNLKPMYQDEFIAGFQHALSNRWTVGVKYTHRNLGSGMDDICEGALAEAWALKNGYSASQAANIGATVAHCFLYNPGRDLTANVDLDDTGTLTPVRIPASALLMPRAKRTYDALELMAERQWDKRWSAQFSYVLSYSRGNTEGYVKSDNGQDDAGITQDFDHPGLMEGSSGYLPNDRRHTFKFSGSFAFNAEWRFGTTVQVQSGRPKNCFGVYAGSIPDDSVLYGASSFYCDGKLVPRGSLGRTPWTRDVSLQAAYTPASIKGLTVTVDAFNIFNERGVRSINETGELDGVGVPNPTYGRPSLASLQRPRYVKLTVGYEF